MDPKTWKKFWSASTLSSFTFGSTIGTQRPEKGHWIKIKAAFGSILRDSALFKCLNGFEDIFPLFPVSRCWSRVFKISLTFCADIVRNAISQGIGAEWVWSAIVPSLGADIAPLASLEAITKNIIIINKYPWPHFKRSPGESSTKNISAKLLSSSMDQIRSYDTWSNTVMKLGPETKCHERACLKFSPPSPTWDQHLQLPRLKHLPKISGGHHSYHWSQLSSIWSFETWVSRRGLLGSRVWSKPTGNICGAWEWEEK